jgi:flagellar biosynthesis anti-sigma factor FlgM
MKIDPRLLLSGEAQPAAVKNSRNSGVRFNGSADASGTKPVTGEDTVSISSAHSDLQTLAANLANVPEVRVDRANALQQRVSSGQYKPDSHKVADAMIAEHSRRSSRA